MSNFCFGILKCECNKEQKYRTPFQKIYEYGSSEIDNELDIIKVIKLLK
jgi:hypothetical protein